MSFEPHARFLDPLSPRGLWNGAIRESDQTGSNLPDTHLVVPARWVRPSYLQTFIQALTLYWVVIPCWNRHLALGFEKEGIKQKYDLPFGFFVCNSNTHNLVLLVQITYQRNPRHIRAHAHCSLHDDLWCRSCRCSRRCRFSTWSNSNSQNSS